MFSNDHDPALPEGVTLRSDGGNRPITAMSNSMWRVLDGIDEYGPRPSPALCAEVPRE